MRQGKTGKCSKLLIKLLLVKEIITKNMGDKLPFAEKVCFKTLCADCDILQEHSSRAG